MTQLRSLLILAGGSSSRMKKSLSSVTLLPSVEEIAQKHHKSLIPFGHRHQPLLYYHFFIAKAAGVQKIFIVTPIENEGFVAFLASQKIRDQFGALEVHLIPQKIPDKAAKPLGTADAVLQAIEQQPLLAQSTFVVLNGDNLYSSDSLQELFALPEKKQAMIGYSRKGLNFSMERIQKFALIHFDEDYLLTQIVEKPTEVELKQCKTVRDEVYVSMNIFKLYGPTIRSYLASCPLHPLRKEKELPVAIQNYVRSHQSSLVVIPREEHVPDMTTAKDIDVLIDQMETPSHFP